jgi:hypothetical protein
MTIENIDDHKAISCKECGSVNYALLKSGWIECNKCQHKIGHWLTSPINPDTESDIRLERIASIESLKMDISHTVEAVELIAHHAKTVPDVMAVCPEPDYFLEMRCIKDISKRILAYNLKK